MAVMAAAPMLAASMEGTWVADVDLDAGSGTATFEFKQAGDVLTGTYSGTLGEAKVTGKVNGKDVEWSFEASAQGETLKVVYKGTVAEDGTVSGKCEYGSLGSGTFKATLKK